MLHEVRTPMCNCNSDIDYFLRIFRDNTRHIYVACGCCGVCALSPVKRESISLGMWRELLIESERRAAGTPEKNFALRPPYKQIMEHARADDTLVDAGVYFSKHSQGGVHSEKQRRRHGF